MAAPRTIGLFQWRMDWADLWLSQCEGPLGFEPSADGSGAGIELRPGDRGADHLLLIGPPVSSGGRPRLAYFEKKKAKLAGRYDAARGELAIRALGRSREDMTMLVYEPPAAFSDAWFEMARAECSRVYAPDDRATHPIVLPSTWSFEDDLRSLRADVCRGLDERPLTIAGVFSGKSMFPGHARRLDFLKSLRRAGVELAIYGRGLPEELGGRGPVISKATILRAAKLTLAIENEEREDRYVSEKLWDPLLCGSVPVYHGSAAADELGMTDAMVRIPDFGEAGVETVRAAAARADEIWESKRGAGVEARRRVLGEMRLAAWACRELG